MLGSNEVKSCGYHYANCSKTSFELAKTIIAEDERLSASIECSHADFDQHRQTMASQTCLLRQNYPVL